MRPPQHIPTLAALILLLIGIGSGIYLIERGSQFQSQAASTPAPKTVMVTNISDTTFTVNWFSDQATVGALIVSKAGLTITSYTRSEPATTPKQIHTLSATGLEPNTKYTFEIVTGGKTFKDKAFTVNTGATLDVPGEFVDPAYGMLLDENGNPVPDALVFVSFPGSQQLSANVVDGGWTIPLGSLRSRELSRYFTPSPTDAETIKFKTATQELTVMATTDTDSPLSETQLNQAPTLQPQVYKKRGLIIAQSQTSGTTSTNVTSSQSFTISAPSENSGVATGKPFIKGTGAANKTVVITISGNGIMPVSGKTVVNGNNQWSWVPPTLLAAGKYALSAASFESDNTPIVLSLAFSVLKSGSSVLADATPSASLEPSPTPVATVSASPTPPPPVSGTVTPTLFLLILGLGLVAVGSTTWVLGKTGS